MSDPQTDTYYIAGILLRFLVRDPEAGYCLVEGLVGPGAGPPPNRHPADDEAFYVLDGTFEFGIGSETRIGKAGDFVKIPRGEVHTFKNVGSSPRRVSPCRLELKTFHRRQDHLMFRACLRLGGRTASSFSCRSTEEVPLVLTAPHSSAGQKGSSAISDRALAQ
jgi:quercetin dioxygenase-like cupin family protein